MGDGMDFLMRPVLAGMCRYESVIDGTLSLDDFADMNEALTIQTENQARIDDAIRARNQ